MSFKSDYGFELKLINQSKFEINCGDKGQATAILQILKKADFVTEVSPIFDLDEDYPDKIIGQTSSQEGLIALLRKWDEDLAGQDISVYKDF